VDSTDHVIFVLQVMLAIGPLALYFLGLGLVNSQSHPCLVRGRSDFLLLTIAFTPVILAPLMTLIREGLFSLALGGILAVGMLFFWLLPRGDSTWVVYNIERGRCRRLIERACRRQDWTISPEQGRIVVAPLNLAVRISGFPLLRNVTLQTEALDGRSESADQALLIDAIRREVDQEAMLPSATGASLVLVGASLLGLPMWFLFHHMDAIVDVVRRILVA
jgi:hypothetical protein